MGKEAKKCDSNFHLVNYPFDQKSWKVSGSAKNRLVWQAIRGGTFGIVIIQLEFEWKLKETAPLKIM